MSKKILTLSCLFLGFIGLDGITSQQGASLVWTGDIGNLMDPATLMIT